MSYVRVRVAVRRISVSITMNGVTMSRVAVRVVMKSITMCIVMNNV